MPPLLIGNLQIPPAGLPLGGPRAAGLFVARGAGYSSGESLRGIMDRIPVPFITIGLLLASNVFMTFAWYGHLKFKSAPLIVVILASWGIAFFEYLLQVPANRIGHGHFTAAELKTIQEVITLVVFAVFSATWLGEGLGWNHAVGFALIAAGAFFVFRPWA